MKKKMGILGGLLMAVVVTGYSVAGTYAKYTSAIDFADEARVAKWNFSLGSENRDIDLFASSYETADGWTDVVSSQPGVKVVAPGTEGEYTFSVTGTAETNYKVALNALVTNDIKTNYVAEDGSEKVYDPIYFSVDGGRTWVNSEGLQTALNALLDANTVYAANSELNTPVTIKWVWAFGTYDEDGTPVADATTGHVTNDELDTQLARLQGKVLVSADLTVVQTEEEATVLSKNSIAKLTSNMSETESTDLETNWKYDASKTAAVKFDGSKITGTIYANTEMDDTFSSIESDQTGYYYPITVNATAGATVRFGSAGHEKTITLGGASETLLMALNPESATKTFVIEVTEVGKEKATYTIDYSGLTFLEK